jgi:hypothetical protein
MADFRPLRALHRGFRSALRVALAATLVGSGGCSPLFVEAPPTEHARLRYFDCTSSRAAPILDTVFASLYGISGVMIATDSSAYHDRTLVASLAFALAAGLGVSAVHGFSTTSECREAKAELLERSAREPAPSEGCRRDTDCKDERICESGACVFALPASLPPAPAPSSPAQPAPPPPGEMPASPPPVAPQGAPSPAPAPLPDAVPPPPP